VEFDGACADSGDNCIFLPATGTYGNKVPGGITYVDQVDFCFDGVTGPVGISYVAYDVDIGKEIEILINGHSVGYASKTPNNAWGARQMVALPDAYVNNDATNILTFNCTGNPPKSWKWGVKEVRYNIGSCAGSCDKESPDGCWCDDLCQEYGDCCPDYKLECPNSIPLPAMGSYGNKVPGGESYPNQVDFSFDGVGGDVGISYVAYDVDIDTEIEILINGQSVGYAPKTVNKAWGAKQMVTLPDAHVSDSASNTLTFNCTGNPPKSWKWGVKEVFQATCAGACGGQSDAGCWCDDACVSYGDCCPDYEAACSTSLAGTWALTNVNGGTFTVTLQPEGYGLRLNHSGVNIVWEGLYEIQGDYLVMTEPDNPSFNGFSWQIVNVDYLYLTNTDYAGSTMIR
jgi:hypothetical protein